MAISTRVEEDDWRERSGLRHPAIKRVMPDVGRDAFIVDFEAPNGMMNRMIFSGTEMAMVNYVDSMIERKIREEIARSKLAEHLTVTFDEVKFMADGKNPVTKKAQTAAEQWADEWLSKEGKNAPRGDS